MSNARNFGRNELDSAIAARYLRVSRGQTRFLLLLLLFYRTLQTRPWAAREEIAAVVLIAVAVGAFWGIWVDHPTAASEAQSLAFTLRVDKAVIVECVKRW